jgi:hypothetical protein
MPPDQVIVSPPSLDQHRAYARVQKISRSSSSCGKIAINGRATRFAAGIEADCLIDPIPTLWLGGC